MQSPASNGAESHGPAFTGRTAIGEHGEQLGDIVVPWDRHWFKLAPKAQRNHAPTSAERHNLEAHGAHH